VNPRSPLEGAASILPPRLIAGAARGLATGPQTVYCQQQLQGTQSIHDQPTDELLVYQTPKSTATMATLDAPVSNKTVNSSMSVQSAVAKAMELNQCHADDKAQVVTKYQADQFEATLIHHNLLLQHLQITQWLREGFPLSLSHPIPLLLNSLPPNNRTGAKLHTAFVHE
jgi:hypothetical protein